LFVEGVDEFRTDEGRVVMAPYAGVLDFRGDLVGRLARLCRCRGDGGAEGR